MTFFPKGKLYSPALHLDTRQSEPVRGALAIGAPSHTPTIQGLPLAANLETGDKFRPWCTDGEQTTATLELVCVGRWPLASLLGFR